MTAPPLFRYFDEMHELLLEQGYLTLFLLSFFASTLIPLGSEWLLVLMIADHHDPVSAVAAATVGNFLGACTTYWVGIYGGPWLIRRVLRIDTRTEAKAERFYVRYGSWSLLLSWLPIVGDALCLAGGILRTGFIRFSVLVFIGKLGRYAAIAWLTLQGARVMTGHLPE